MRLLKNTHWTLSPQRWPHELCVPVFNEGTQPQQLRLLYLHLKLTFIPSYIRLFLQTARGLINECFFCLHVFRCPKQAKRNAMVTKSHQHHVVFMCVCLCESATCRDRINSLQVWVYFVHLLSYPLLNVNALLLIKTWCLKWWHILVDFIIITK